MDKTSQRTLDAQAKYRKTKKGKAAEQRKYDNYRARNAYINEHKGD